MTDTNDFAIFRKEFADMIVHEDNPDGRERELLMSKLEAENLRALLREGLEAFRLTREYVTDLLPSIEGWAWFDWCEQVRSLLDDAAPATEDRLAIMLHNTDDAKVWATEFIKVLEDGDGPPAIVDLELALTWFANAISCGATHQAARDRRDAGAGASAIAFERQRQREVEGWTAEHDAEHDKGELKYAAVAYALAAKPQFAGDSSFIDDVWPWKDEDWKPSDDPIRNLVKAGALIAAEIDRLFVAKAATEEDELTREEWDALYPKLRKATILRDAGWIDLAKP